MRSHCYQTREAFRINQDHYCILPQLLEPRVTARLCFTNTIKAHYQFEDIPSSRSHLNANLSHAGLTHRAKPSRGRSGQHAWMEKRRWWASVLHPCILSIVGIPCESWYVSLWSSSERSPDLGLRHVRNRYKKKPCMFNICWHYNIQHKTLCQHISAAWAYARIQNHTVRESLHRRDKPIKYWLPLNNYMWFYPV